MFTEPMETTILPNDALTCFSGLIPDAVCKFLIDRAENGDKRDEKEWKFKPCGFGGSLNPSIRNSWEVRIEDHEIREMFWRFVKPFVPQVAQGRTIIGPHHSTFYLLRYNPGEKFEPHRDGHSTSSSGEKSFFTALIYLSNCKGGETIFFEEPMCGLSFVNGDRSTTTIKPQKGLFVLMRHYVYHQAMPVTEGTKYVLRFNILCEKYGTKGWYSGPSRPDVKAESVAHPSCDRPDGTPERVYNFLPRFTEDTRDFVPGRLPRLGEDRCENCHEILDLDYDYYACPGCASPVCLTSRFETR